MWEPSHYLYEVCSFLSLVQTNSTNARSSRQEIRSISTSLWTTPTFETTTAHSLHSNILTLPDLCEPVAKKRWLEVEDLFGFKELDNDFNWHWQANNWFDILCSICSGAYATVYKVISREWEKLLETVKNMIFRVDPIYTIPPHLIQEITNLCCLHSRNCEPPIIRWEKETLLMLSLYRIF